jgi:hypothetical protein
MRALILVVGLALAGIAPAAELLLPVPVFIDGGIPGLRAWLGKQEFRFAADIVDIVEYDKERKFAAVVHNTGSGVTSLDVYVYGCDEASCSMIMSRAKIPSDDRAAKPITLTLTKDRKTVEVKSSGVTYLRGLLVPPK